MDVLSSNDIMLFPSNMLLKGHCAHISEYCLSVDINPFHSVGIPKHIGVIRKFAENSFSFLHRLINRIEITARNTATHMQLVVYNMLDVSRLCVTNVVKATLYSPNRPILRCILTFYYTTFCKSLLCYDSPYCVPCIFNDIFTPLLCKLSKIYM